MNFGDILDKWENQSGKKPTMEELMAASEIYDKDKEIEGNKRAIIIQKNRRRLKNKRPDAELDIHGLNRDEAWLSLNTFFDNAKKNEMEKVLIIHGKGNHSLSEPVLNRMVLEFIEQCPYAGESGRGKANIGGNGATWVLIK